MKSTIRMAMAVMLMVASTVTAATTLLSNSPTIHENLESLQKRAYFKDDYKIFIRKRHAHACMMSIVFIVLFPLGAISMHLPLRGIRVTTRIHLPIQLLGLAMMIGAMGLGIDIGHVDLNYFSKSSSTKAHVVIGLLTCSVLILFQPALGILQHRHFRRTGRKSVFAYGHRWTGRVAICLGWINSGLGFQLVPISLVSTGSLVRNFVLMGVLGFCWFGLVSWNGWRHHVLKKEKLGAFRIGWERGFVLRKSQDRGSGEHQGNLKLMPHALGGNEECRASREGGGGRIDVP